MKSDARYFAVNSMIPMFIVDAGACVSIPAEPQEHQLEQFAVHRKKIYNMLIKDHMGL